MWFLSGICNVCWHKLKDASLLTRVQQSPGGPARRLHRQMKQSRNDAPSETFHSTDVALRMPRVAERVQQSINASRVSGEDSHRDRRQAEIAHTQVYCEHYKQKHLLRVQSHACCQETAWWPLPGKVPFLFFLRFWRVKNKQTNKQTGNRWCQPPTRCTYGVNFKILCHVIINLWQASQRTWPLTFDLEVTEIRTHPRSLVEAPTVSIWKF